MPFAIKNSDARLLRETHELNERRLKTRIPLLGQRMRQVSSIGKSSAAGY